MRVIYNAHSKNRTCSTKKKELEKTPPTIPNNKSPTIGLPDFRNIVTTSQHMCLGIQNDHHSFYTV